MKIPVSYLFFLLFFFEICYSVENLNSEFSSINGYVTDNETDETLIGATVSFEGTKYGTFTNKDGYYTITGIIPGEYKVIVSFIGYEKINKKIKLKIGETTRLNFNLKVNSFITDEIKVEADRDIEKKEINISKINIPIQQIKGIKIGGESDVFRSLQFLPGILTSSQLSSGLFVRGGSPDQNLVLLDGSTVYNPTHIFGFISTFNTDAIKDVELIKGGFGAEYGGRLSAVLNLTQKDGNKKDYEGNASIGVLSSKANLQGPIGNGSWFIGGRRTYFDLIRMIIPENPESPLPDFGFYDANIKITQDLSDNDKIFISGFISNDRLELSNSGISLILDIGNLSGSIKWNHIFGSDLFSTLLFSSSSYKNNFVGDQAGYVFEIKNSITDFSLKYSLDWFLSDILNTKYGFEVNNYNFKYYSNLTGEQDSVSSSGSRNLSGVNIQPIDWNYSVYAKGIVNFTDLLSFQFGIRFNYWDLSRTLLIDPRMALRYNLTENIKLKAAYGLYSQNLRLAAQPDFSFFDTWLPTDNSVEPSRAEHFIFTVETEPWNDMDLNIDIYKKNMVNVSELNTFITDPKDLASIFYIGNSNSWGAEIFLQKKYGKFSGWVGYAIGFIESRFDSINGGEPYRPKYDRTHDFKIVTDYRLNETWEFGASFSFQSGQSYTGATSRFQILLPEQTKGRGKLMPSQRYGLRLPPSHQLNIFATYNFTMFGLASKVTLDIFNVYNRRDIWFRYYNTRTDDTKVEDVKLLPIIPTLSLEVKFL